MNEHELVERLIERSSIGTAAAKRLRARTNPSVRRRILKLASTTQSSAENGHHRTDSQCAAVSSSTGHNRDQ
jgi:hypothetical protein